MIQPGQFGTLTVCEESPFGVYFDIGNNRKVFATNKALPKPCKLGDKLTGFVYQESDGALAVTFDAPKARVGEFARLTVVEITSVGAFLDWGLPKDLFVPFGEQFKPLKEGQSPVVYVYQNKADGRVVASTKTDKFLDKTPPDYKVGAEVDLIVTDKSDLGMKVIINHAHSGLIHKDDLHSKLKYGQKIRGFIKHIRADEKIDVCLQKTGLEGRDALADKIIALLQENNGILTITDKSSPELIAKVFGVSKKQYKMALGKLYKEEVISINVNDVRLLQH